MKKLYLTIFLLMAAVVFTSAQQTLITLQGHVFNHNTGAAISGQIMIISVDSLNTSGNVYKVVTDEKGLYIVEIPYKTGSSYMAVSVSTYECNGTMVTSVGFFYPDFLNLTLDFSICDEKPRECVALFKIQPASNDSLTFYFMDGSYTSSGLNLLNYLWDFGDGTYSTEQSLLHKFNKPGFYNVCLRIVNSSDTLCSDKFCLPLQIGETIPAPCENSFWYYNDSLGASVVFNGYLKNGQADSWTWDFGDGTTATGQTVTHTFASLETSFSVCLTTTGIGSDGTICNTVSCQDVFIHFPSPCMSYFWYQPDSSGLGYSFEGYSKNYQINSWNWDFGDGTTATGQKVFHLFSDANTGHNVCLTTSSIGADGVSCSFVSCQEVYIYYPSPCENYFKANSNDGSTYSFSGNLKSGGGANYFWDLGDGTTATGQQVEHTFLNTGAAINVCLTTIGIDNSANDTCKSISCQMIFPGIDSSSCKAIIYALPDSSSYSYYFQNGSQGNYNFILWDFGDGGQSLEPNPFHTYLNPGIYIVCLTIGDSLNNCWNQSCQEIWVDIIQPACQASFIAIPDDSITSSSCLSFRFINTSEPGNTNQKWSFGDGTGSSDLNPVHCYADPGVYNVCLTIWDSPGICKSTYCMDIFAGNVIGNYTVSGIVMAGNNLADKGTVWLISPTNSYYAETNVDSAGSYYFRGVPYGSYYIYAMLTPGSSDFFAYMPTYYSSSLSWQGATTINTGEPNAWYPINLVPSMYWSLGDAVITGTITWSSLSKAEGIPAANVEVVLLNSSGSPIAYTFTNSDGTYEFYNLTYGEYSVQAEMPGKTTQVITVTLTESSPDVNIDFRINESAIYYLGLDALRKSNQLAGDPYPNPAGETLYLEMNASASETAVIDIMDVQGRIIRSQSIALSKGSNRISVASGSLSKGIYLLKINIKGQEPIQHKFIK